MEIQHIKSHKIDRDKWDACIRAASNGVVYAYSWYLEYTATEWVGLVADDYHVVMPLPVENIMGFKLVSMPSFIPALGVFSSDILSPGIVQEMIAHIPYRHLLYVFNAYNKVDQTNKSTFNYSVLDLIPSLHTILNRVSPNGQVILTGLDGKEISVARSLDVQHYITFREQHQKQKKAKQRVTLQQLISFAVRYKSAGLYGAYDEFNELIAVAFLIKTNNTLFLIDAVSSIQGKTEYGLHAIIYHIIRNNTESNLTLEFPFHSKELGHCFSKMEHECQQIVKGIGRFIP